MNRARRAMLYSGLVLPGLGQWMLGRKAKGLLIMVSVVGLVLWLAARIFLLVYRNLVPSGELSSMRIDPQTITHVHHQAYLDNWWLLALIVVIWIGSMVDALLADGKMRGSEGKEG